MMATLCFEKLEELEMKRDPLERAERGNVRGRKASASPAAGERLKALEETRHARREPDAADCPASIIS